MNKFKIGDKLRCTHHYNDTHWPKGWEFILTENTYYYGNPHVKGRCKNGEIGEISTSNCELADSLEDLVKKANDGEAAYKIIKEKYPNEVEYRGTNHSEWKLIDNHLFNMLTFRIKNKKLFKQFRSTKGEVYLDTEGLLHIGCQVFNREDAHMCIKTLFQHGGSYMLLMGTVYATRDGLKFFNNVLPWSECEIILSQLNEMGQQ